MGSADYLPNSAQVPFCEFSLTTARDFLTSHRALGTSQQNEKRLGNWIMQQMT